MKKIPLAKLLNYISLIILGGFVLRGLYWIYDGFSQNIYLYALYLFGKNLVFGFAGYIAIQYLKEILEKLDAIIVLLNK